MSALLLIGLDFGTLSVRGVLIDAESGTEIAHHVVVYRHAVMSERLADGTPLPAGFALQDAADDPDAAEAVLARLGRDQDVAAIGVDFTASSPLPARRDGTPLSTLMPSRPHAYVKLWKHRTAQPFADRINAVGGHYLDNFGGRLSGEWLLAKAAEIAAEDPEVWAAAERFIEAGDWLVWQLTGRETRNLGFAVYKAQYDRDAGYPAEVVPGLGDKLAPPKPAGSAAGPLSDAWRLRTGIRGPAAVAVAIIDSHAVLPAVGAVSDGSFVGALGTSAAYLLLSEKYRPLPANLEGMARDGSLPGFWLYEAGQASFGDMLAWFVRTFPRGRDLAASFDAYNGEAATLPPGGRHLVGLDWWNGNRVPFADSRLSGLLVGLGMKTTAAEIYRALIEAVCYGARHVFEMARSDGFDVRRVIMTSGLAENNPLLISIMADIFDREIEVPEIAHATAVGAAIHGAVAAGVVGDYAEGAARYGARSWKSYRPDPHRAAAYGPLYAAYCDLSACKTVRSAMRRIGPMANDRSDDDPNGAV